MNVVGKVSSFITQGMYSVATPFHPFGGAVDIIVVKQNDGTFRSTPWYVRFGKFQGVLKGAEKLVRIEVNGVEANFHMCLDNSGEAYFLREVDHGNDVEGLQDSGDLEVVKEEESHDQENSFNCLGEKQLVNVECEGNTFYEIQNDQVSLEGTLEFQAYGDSGGYDTLHSLENALESQNSTSEVVLVSVDGHILTAPISSSEVKSENVQLSTPQFHLGPGGGTEAYDRGGTAWTPESSTGHNASIYNVYQENVSLTHIESSSSKKHVAHDGEEGEQLGTPHEALESLKRVCMDAGSDILSGSLIKEEELKSSSEFPHLALQPEKENHQILVPEDISSTSNSENSAAHELCSLARDSDGHDASSLLVGRASYSEQESGVNAPVETKLSNVDLLIASGHEQNEIKRDKSHLEGLEISLCRNLLHAGMGLTAAQIIFEANRISMEEFKLSASTIVKNENLVVRIQGKYLPWNGASHIILGLAAFGLSLPVEPSDVIPVELDVENKEESSAITSTPRRQWRLWPIPFRRVTTLEHSASTVSTEENFLDAESFSQTESVSSTPTSPRSAQSPRKQYIRTKVPTTDQIGSLNLREGQNMVNFLFWTRMLGAQKVEAHIYLWRWNTRIVISDVDGTITKSDVLGQFMPLVGRDWTHSGIARLFSAIKENGYQLLFLSARAIVQAYLTKNFLSNLKQDGKSLPDGPVFISPDGLFPSLYREVIKRAPHEFKIACLEDLKALFPPDYNPFYAGFGNRATDELSYLKIGIPKGKIFIINPKGEVAINHRIDVKSYTSLHTLVNDMFPPTSMVEQEDFNSWNYWKMSLPEIDNL